LQGDRGGCGRIGHDDQKAQICAVTGTNTKLQIANAFANLFKTKAPKKQSGDRRESSQKHAASKLKGASADKFSL